MPVRLEFRSGFQYGTGRNLQHLMGNGWFHSHMTIGGASEGVFCQLIVVSRVEPSDLRGEKEYSLLCEKHTLNERARMLRVVSRVETKTVIGRGERTG